MEAPLAQFHTGLVGVGCKWDVRRNAGMNREGTLPLHSCKCNQLGHIPPAATRVTEPYIHMHSVPYVPGRPRPDYLTEEA